MIEASKVSLSRAGFLISKKILKLNDGNRVCLGCYDLHPSIISHLEHKMRAELKAKILQICDEKITKKGSNVGLSFYAFFANKNDNPELLMEAAKWWIKH